MRSFIRRIALLGGALLLLPACFDFSATQFPCEEGGTGSKACPPGLVCLEQECITPCGNTEDCDPNDPTAACLAGVCRSFSGTCTTQDDCPESGWFCSAAQQTCFRKFQDEETCVAGQQCRGGRCQDGTCTENDGVCPSGFEDTSALVDGSECVDIDECSDSALNDCSMFASCDNTIGSYTCVCPAGFTDDSTSEAGRVCNDIDECLLSGTCAPGVQCFNAVGTFGCGDCPFGFRGDGATCVDIDECVELMPCDPLAPCNNLPGDFSCGACPSGFVDTNADGTVCTPLLLGLQTSAGVLEPTFDSSVVNYSIRLDPSVSQIVLTPAASPLATIEVEGVAIDSGLPSAPLDVPLGTRDIDIEVSANGNSRNYTFQVRTWRGISTPSTTTSWRSVAWSPANDTFVALGGSADVIASADGTTWSENPSSQLGPWSRLVWAPALGLFVAVSDSTSMLTANWVMTSPDGDTWTGQSSAPESVWNDLVWSPERALLVAVGSGGGDLVMTSPGGINWTVRTAAESNSWKGVAWSPSLGLFAAVAEDGTNRVMTSSNGTTWTARSAPASSWQSVVWSPEQAVFVAVADGGTDRVMTSSTGTSWTARATPLGGANWRRVSWGANPGVFVAVGESQFSTENRIMTSQDGTNWALQLAPQNNRWRDVTHAPELQLFLAVGAMNLASFGGGDQVVMASP